MPTTFEPLTGAELEEWSSIRLHTPQPAEYHRMADKTLEERFDAEYAAWRKLDAVVNDLVEGG